MSQTDQFDLYLSHLPLADGDLLVFRSEHTLSAEQARTIHTFLSEAIGRTGRAVVPLVLDAGATLERVPQRCPHELGVPPTATCPCRAEDGP